MDQVKVNMKGETLAESLNLSEEAVARGIEMGNELGVILSDRQSSGEKINRALQYIFDNSKTLEELVAQAYQLGWNVANWQNHAVPLASLMAMINTDEIDKA